MIDFLTYSTPSAIVLAVVASLAWAACLVMAALRWRAFRQRADLSWILAYLFLLGASLGRLWTAYVWWSVFTFSETIFALSVPKADRVDMHTSGMAAVDLVISVLFAAASLLAVLANRRRPDTFD